MSWQQRIIEKLKSFGYEPKVGPGPIEFWIESEIHIGRRGFVRVWRFDEDGIHATYFSYDVGEGICHHSAWIIKEEIYDSGAPLYTYHFTDGPTVANPFYTKLSYKDLERRIVHNLEDSYRVPNFEGERMCVHCNAVPINCFWTTCNHQLDCYTCLTGRAACAQCGEPGRAKRFRTKTILD
jgi:hypothetical protein